MTTRREPLKLPPLPPQSLAAKQRRWLRGVDYNLTTGRRNASTDTRLRRFREFQPPVSQDLKPPVQVDEDIAKSASGPRLYPVFQGGQVSHHEDTVGEVIEELDAAIERIIQRGDYTEDQAREIRVELEHFRRLAKQAYESAAKADRLADEAEQVASGARALTPPAPRSTEPDQPRGDDSGESLLPDGADEDDAPAESPPDPEAPGISGEPNRPAEAPRLVDDQLNAERAAARAKVAQAKAAQARKHAQDAAVKAEEMRQSLARLHGMVGDAALTAHGLPDDRDDEADRMVSKAKWNTDKPMAPSATRSGWSPSAWTALSGSPSTPTTWPRTPPMPRSASTKPWRNGDWDGAAPEELRQAAAQERRNAAGPAPSRVDVETAKFFRPPRATRTDEEGEMLTATFGNPPASPPFKAPPIDKPGSRRAYQEEILGDLNSGPFDESVLVTAPTGAGKTVIMAHYISDLRRQGKSVAVMAHTKELVDQSQETIQAVTGERVGRVQAETKEWDRPVTVISHGTVVDSPDRRIPRDFRPDVLIIDEAHHSAAEGFQDIIGALEPEKLVGFTATPYRADDKSLGSTYQRTISRVTTEDLLDKGYLVPPSIVDVDLRGTDKAPRRINEAGNLPDLYAQGISHAAASGRNKILVFVSGSEDNKPTEVVQDTTDRLKALGYRSGEVTANTSPAERERAVSRFQRSSRGVLINYGTLNEGFDAPSTDAIVLGRNVGSDGTLQQIIGRGMRPDPQGRKADVLVVNYSDRKAADIDSLIRCGRTNPRDNAQLREAVAACKRQSEARLFSGGTSRRAERTASLPRRERKRSGARKARGTAEMRATRPKR